MESGPTAGNWVFYEHAAAIPETIYPMTITMPTGTNLPLKYIKNTKTNTLGELENTLIFYASDHGDTLGDHHLWRKCRPHEGSSQIPMIVPCPENLPLKAKRVQVMVVLLPIISYFSFPGVVNALRAL